MQREVDEQGQLQPWVFRLGVEFADGRRATNVGARMGPLLDEESEPDGLLVHDHGGGGGGGHWSRMSMASASRSRSRYGSPLTSTATRKETLGA